MASPAQTEFSYAFRMVVMQFQAYLSQPENAKIVQSDQSELASLMMEIGVVSGNPNVLLQHNTELTVRAGWFYHKYNGFFLDLSRDNTTHFNLIYTAKREHGWNEWDAKRAAESDKAYLDQARAVNRMQQLVGILKVLVDSCKDRLSALQQISNNYRAEIREVTI